MGQVESVEENSTVTNTVDPEMLEKSREALYSLFAMNKDTFGDMCNNSTLLAQEMISHKTRLASNIQPFFGDDSCVCKSSYFMYFLFLISFNFKNSL